MPWNRRRNFLPFSWGRVKMRAFVRELMHGLRQSPWMTRREAAEYLRWTVEEVDGNLVPLESHPEQVRGKMRYQVMAVDRDLRLRILAADVFILLPLPFLPSSRPERFYL